MWRAVRRTLVVVPLSLLLSRCSDHSIHHRDLVAAAQAIGMACDAPNPQRVTLCDNVTFVDGDRELARRLYETRCIPDPDEPADLGAWVWYDDDHWELELSGVVTREAVRVISDKLGVEAKDCRREIG